MKPLSVYVHIPFCTIKCGYCDFNAYAGMDALKRAYGEALVAEVRANGPLFAGRSIRSVGFGGGTPGEVPASAYVPVGLLVGVGLEVVTGLLLGFAAQFVFMSV